MLEEMGTVAWRMPHGVLNECSHLAVGLGLEVGA